MSGVLPLQAMNGWLLPARPVHMLATSLIDRRLTADFTASPTHRARYRRNLPDSYSAYRTVHSFVQYRNPLRRIA
jgi:hypothetical protein